MREHGQRISPAFYYAWPQLLYSRAMPRLSLRWRLNLTFAAVLALLLGLDLGLTVLGAGQRIDPEIANATALASGVFREAVQTLPPTPDVVERLQKLAVS